MQRMHERQITQILIYDEKLLDAQVKRIIRSLSPSLSASRRMISIFACHSQVSLSANWPLNGKQTIRQRDKCDASVDARSCRCKFIPMQIKTEK